MTDTNKTNNDKMSMEDYENLLDKYQFSQKEVSAGSIVKGRVIKIAANHVLVDIGMKSEGMIPLEEFGQGPDAVLPKPGDEIEASLEGTDHKEGHFILSKKKADAEKALEVLDKAAVSGAFVSGKIVDRARGGYSVDVGILAFMPDSHADLRPVKNPESLLGETGKF